MYLVHQSLAWVLVPGWAEGCTQICQPDVDLHLLG